MGSSPIDDVSEETEIKSVLSEQLRRRLLLPWLAGQVASGQVEATWGRGPPLGRGSTPHAAGNHPPAESRLPMRPLFLLRPLAASVLDANVRKLRKKGENGLGSFLGF